MIRTTISKIRQACALTFVPRLLRGDLRLAPDRFERLSVNVQRRVDKSTSSSKPEEDDDYIRCQRIIERAFSPNVPYAETKKEEVKRTKKEAFLGLVVPDPPSTPEAQCEKCNRIIKEIFGEDNIGDRNTEKGEQVVPITELQATTAKEEVETLAQKVERIDETPLVEAPAKRKVEGFNVQPKVLGKRRKRRAVEEQPLLHYATDKTCSGRSKGTSDKDSSLDELAKRCLDSPSTHIDERLLKEMEKLGVPPTSRKGSRRTATDRGIIQPEIMRRPRRPVEKTELDFLKRTRIRYSERLNSLPPPFELIPAKSNSVNIDSMIEMEENILLMERIPLYHLKDQILSDVADMPEETENQSVNRMLENPARVRFTESEIQADEYPEERSSQHMLGHMTATVMTDETTIMTDKSNEIEHLVIKQEQLDTRDYKDALDSGAQCSGVKEKSIDREKLASTNILSELVDPKEISPSSGAINEYNEIEMLRNLLRTRIEYLSQEKVKRLHPTCDVEKESTRIEPEVDRVLLREFTDSEVDDTLHQLGIEKVKLEKVEHHHLKEELNNMSKGKKPGVLVRECTAQKPMETPIMFKSHSEKRGMITPHQLFEELSLISRETEIGVGTEDSHDIKDKIKARHIDKSAKTSGNSTAGQLLENVGMISKGSTVDGSKGTISDSNVYSKQSDAQAPLTKDNEVEDDQEKSKLNDGFVYTTTDVKHREEEYEQPIIAEETTRLPLPPEALLPEHKLATTRLRETREPILSSIPETPVTPMFQSTRTVRETILSPLLDRSAVAHVGNTNIPPITPGNTQIPSDLSSMSAPAKAPKEQAASKDKQIPLSEMLRRVRERNRMEFCKQFEVRMVAPEVEPVVGECGKKKPPCPPPAPVCPPPPPPPPPPTEPPCPKPCKPKCPPTCPPTPCEQKPKCPPVKKNPCEKFKKCSPVQVQDALSLLLYLGPQFHVPEKSLLLSCMVGDIAVPKEASTEYKNLSDSLIFVGDVGSVDALGSAKDFAKTYDPWIPIPSWPIPVKEKKRKLVCPKDGCRVDPPKLKPPCKGVNPCLNFPKKHFSIIDYITGTLRKKKIYDIGEF